MDCVAASTIAAMRRWQSQAWCQQHITALLAPGSVASASAPGCRPAQAAPGCRLVRTRYGHPLSGPSGLHNAALPSVSASQSQAPFVAATASRTLGEGNKRYAKWPSLESVASAGGATPVALRPGAFSCAPYGSASTLALVSALARSGGSQRPSAGHHKKIVHGPSVTVALNARPCPPPFRQLSFAI